MQSLTIKEENGQLFKWCPGCHKWFEVTILEDGKYKSEHFYQHGGTNCNLDTCCRYCKKIRRAGGTPRYSRAMKKIKTRYGDDTLMVARQLQQIPPEKLAREIARFIP